MQRTHIIGEPAVILCSLVCLLLLGLGTAQWQARTCPFPSEPLCTGQVSQSHITDGGPCLPRE